MPERYGFFRVAEAAGVWDVDFLEENMSYALLNQWLDYLEFNAKISAGWEPPIKLDPADMMKILGASFGAKVVKKG